MTGKVKPIVGILTGNGSLFEGVLKDLEKSFGPHDVLGDWIFFEHTTYYNEEMGEGLNRRFVSFENLIESWDAGKFKGWIKEIEEKYSIDGKRQVNLDPGYIDANKVVLITGKRGAHKIALPGGVWADMLLWYNKGWVPLPWAFPDFRDGKLFPVFMEMRGKFKKQTKVVVSA